MAVHRGQGVIPARGVDTGAGIESLASRRASIVQSPRAQTFVRGPAPIFQPDQSGRFLAGGLAAGMLNDYYNRVIVIPQVLEVQNPVTGQDQPFSLWNAFLRSNQITARNDISATGLTNSALVGQTFRALQLRSFAVVVTPLAPSRVDATYEFTFTQGSTTFRFIAVRATAISIPPEGVSEQILEYQTDVFRSRNGLERRFALRSNAPRQSFGYEVIFDNDQERRELRQDLFRSALAQLVLPLWHEPFRLTAAAPQGTNTIVADFSLSDLQVGDQVYLETYFGDQNELNRVGAITATELTLESVTSADFPIRSAIYPTAAIQPEESQTVQYYPVNALRYQVAGIATSARNLGGNGATLTTHFGLPVLEREPSANDLVEESFTLRPEITDFGGAFDYFSAATFANMARQMEFRVRSRADFQYWKLFLDTIFGRRDPFLHATYQNDVVPVSFLAGGNGLTIQNTPSLRRWLDSLGHQDLRIEVTPGPVEIYRRINSFTDNGDGTASLILNDVIPNLGPTTDIRAISLLPLVRLASDRVRFRHFNTFSIVNLTIETVEQ